MSNTPPAWTNPRLIRFAPNGDLFVADSEVDRKPDTGKIRVFRGVDASGKPKEVGIYATGLAQPFGIAFYPLGPNPQWLYIGNTDTVVRFPYKNGDLKASGPPKSSPTFPAADACAVAATGPATSSSPRTASSCSSPSAPTPTSTTPTPIPRNSIAPTCSSSPRKANSSRFTPPVSATASARPSSRETGELWCSVNERDALGDNLVPDYITHVKEDGFYGWPWYYMGSNQDPRLAGKHPELLGRVTVPDVLLQPHFASLEMTFYEGSEFPASYKGQIFAAEHGSWNKSKRAGYEVIMVPVKDGKATGEYEDFLTGFVTPDGDVWGRPVGVAVAPDGSLFVTDDGTRSIWHVTYVGGGGAATGH